MFKTINPYTQELLAEYPVLSQKELDIKLEKSSNAFQTWKNTTFHYRAAILQKAAQILRRDQEKFALTITLEMGKILPESRAEIEKSAGNCEFYSNNAEQFLQDTPVEMGLHKSVITYQPIGAVFAIMPWNYPFWQVIRYIAPCLMAGNVSLLKHAPNVLGCAKHLEEIFLEAGLPEGVFQAITIDIPQVEQVIAHDAVQLVTLTGSEAAGSAVAALAGKHIKKSVMELGGSDGFIVLNDADLELATTVATQSRMMNAGQACICAKRFIVVEDVANEFLDKFSQKIAQLKQGNPLEEGINMGPLARIDLANNLSQQLQQSISQGGILKLGGQQDQCNFQPTLLDGISADNIVFQQETFGPLATVIRAKNEQHAIELANNHKYGLACALWTKDLEKAYHLARRIDSGNVFVNSLVRSDSRLPFGGIKKSGYGRELGEIGIKELCNVKSIVIE